MRAMHLRRSLALLGGALLLAAPLTSCGFDLATNQVNTIAAGTNNRDTSVDVLGAAVVSGEEGSGTFVATFVNNDVEEPATVESLEPQDAGAAQVVDFTPIEIAPNGLVNLAEEDQRVVVEGDLAAGDNLPMVVQLGSGDTVELDVPVVPNCNEWEGIDANPGDCEVAEPEGEH
jgi:hypothetical protein